MTKRKMLTFLVCFLMGNQIIAQVNKQIVSGNNNVAASIPDSIKYLYPSFIYGKVYYKDGTSGGSILNYNLLAGAIQFVNQTGDTLSLANEVTIKFVTISLDTFYYDRVYVKLIAGNVKAQLAKSEKISLADIKRGAAFDSYTSSGGVDNVSSLNIGSRTIRLTENKQMVFVIRNVWYVGDSYHHFLPATRKNVLKIFGKVPNLNAYITDHNIDFMKEADLRSLIEFVGQSTVNNNY